MISSNIKKFVKKNISNFISFDLWIRYLWSEKDDLKLGLPLIFYIKERYSRDGKGHENEGIDPWIYPRQECCKNTHKNQEDLKFLPMK